MAKTNYDDRAKGMSPRQATRYIEHAISSFRPDGTMKDRTSVMVWGAFGIGKSQILSAIAKWRKMARVVDLRLATMDPTDLTGVPMLRNYTIQGEELTDAFYAKSHMLPRDRVVFKPKGTVFTAPFALATDLTIYAYKGDDLVLRIEDQELDDLNNLGINVTYSQVSRGEWEVNFSEDVDGKIDRLVIEDKAIILLDEVSAAPADVQSAALGLVLDRFIGDYFVPSGVPIVAAGNREQDGANIDTMNAPLANRFAHITMEPNADEWIEWAIDNGKHPNFAAFIKSSPQSLHIMYDDTIDSDDWMSQIGEGSYGMATPRSWAAVAEQYVTMEEAMEMCGDDIRDAQVFRQGIMEGFLGQLYAARFMAWEAEMANLPSTDDIIKGRVTSLRDDIPQSARYGLTTQLMGALLTLHKSLNVSQLVSEDKLSSADAVKWATSWRNVMRFLTNHISIEVVNWFCITLRTISMSERSTTKLALGHIITTPAQIAMESGDAGLSGVEQELIAFNKKHGDILMRSIRRK